MVQFSCVEIPDGAGTRMIAVDGELYRSPGRGRPSLYGTIEHTPELNANALSLVIFSAHMLADDLVALVPEFAPEQKGRTRVKLGIFLKSSQHGSPSQFSVSVGPEFY